MSKESVRESKAATEYRLSISSNPGSRRSSFGGSSEHPAGSGIGNNKASNGELREATLVDTLLLPQVQELKDSMITLDANLTHMNFIHESLVDLNESVSALLYGLMCNSWCVDFPNMPHHTARELGISKELARLKEEKQQLLADLQGTAQAPSLVLKEKEPNTSKQKFQLPKPPMVSTRSVVAPVRTISEEEEDDNTAASFVSNPTVMGQPPHAPPPVARSNNAKGRRRYSILQQIRNHDLTGQKHMVANLGGTVKARAATHPIPESAGEKRKSLAVSAVRIGNNKRLQTSRPPSGGRDVTMARKRSGTQPAILNTNSITHSSTGAVPASSAQGRRPPFR
ncbi:AAR029Wp [Eremothecium gossypii ATCC 10895]|uniref:DASH complex subunit DAM1 n=1 Tax=Eremothecium gossypii (strain ATCC 10895 / CBS 109.51 / FGSC 9923 / NRRL Y-1056) TaxID=284811 RepID=DAM1_EREGS|nr:AAR029Wp [Eremothecium gossypii ATCC 10895]Q75EQ0.2 RecName: Full=DASH complex subunit DAM1; AltName: Full=Outer kinetochore protein DAM1 [Eremothecium gossypii ATCC 10895]AAS50394.2 AAR029Wp [Eremothecium gossypii ATCC 10895]AEY94680.1 FAAR029Wp [Eremothecium gossypii FDAG1]